MNDQAHPSPLRLHLGCGDIRLPGYVNIDSRATAATDVVDDVGTLGSFRENTVDAIYACHILEHFHHDNATGQATSRAVVSRWHALLRDGGILYVAVPDLDAIFCGLKKTDGHRQQASFIMALFGGQNYEGNTHFNGFTLRSLTNLLEACGFGGVRRFESFVDDTSRVVLHGIPFSLNLVAVKNGPKAPRTGWAALLHRWNGRKALVVGAP